MRETIIRRFLFAFTLLLGGTLSAQADDPVGAKDEQDPELKALEEAARDPFRARARMKVEELDRTYGEGFFTYIYDDGIMPRPYVVAAEAKANVDRETIAKEYADILGSLYEVFYREFGELLELDPITDPVVVLIYDSRDSYKKMREDRPELNLANEEFMAGYYMPGTGVLTQWRQPNLWEVMFHEGTHQLIDFATRKWNFPQSAESPWFQEGFADFMGGHKRKLSYSEEKQGFVNEFTLGQFIDHRYSGVQGAMITGDAMTLKELTHLDFLTFKRAQNDQDGKGANQRVTNLVYTQGWSLVMFLNYYQDGKYQPQLREYMQAEVRGEGGGEKFAEIFWLEADEDWDDLNREYREYVFGDLRRMGRDD